MNTVFKSSVIFLTLGVVVVYAIIVFSPMVTFYIHDEGCYKYDMGKPVWAIFLLPFIFTIPVFAAHGKDSRMWLSDMFFTTMVLQIAWMSCLGIHEYLIIQLNNEWVMDSIPWQQKNKWIANTHLFTKYFLLVFCTLLPLSLALRTKTIHILFIRLTILSLLFFVGVLLGIIDSDFEGDLYCCELFTYTSIIPLLIGFSFFINTLAIWNFSIPRFRKSVSYA